MTGFKKFRDGFIGPIIILTVISLLVTWAVAGTFQVADPIIKELEIEKARLARVAVLEDADDFAQYEGIELPAGVAEAFRANNGAGFVFQASAKGYGGSVPFMIGVDADGNVVGIQMLTHSETSGLGSRVGDPGYLGQYIGHNDPTGPDAISGATKTSNALKNSLKAALEAYEQLKDVNP